MPHPTHPRTVIIGGGPAGLMAAEQLANAGYSVDLYDAMPSVGRKFLLAGIGGLNITHAEPFSAFCQRYAERQPQMEPLLERFGADELRQWCSGLGVETFVGTSGRVFPKEMKAAPLLRAWLTRLKKQGVQIHPRHRWQGWDEQGRLLFQNPEGQLAIPYTAVILALGGGSWRKLGSNGEWIPLLNAHGVNIAPLQASNCGFLCHWSEYLQTRFAGAPLKSVALSFTDLTGQHETRIGEMILTRNGVEGSLIYAFSARLRDMLNERHSATFYLDLLPNHSLEQVSEALRQKPARKTLSTFLKNRWRLDGVKTALLFETLDKSQLQDIPLLARTLKAIPVTVTATTPLDEAISTAGGIRFEGVDENLMLTALPGVFCAGEMLDWEAPTGGYLLAACFASGREAGQGAIRWLKTQ
jgi:hypothetical protein